jgi:hypothetical protein
LAGKKQFFKVDCADVVGGYFRNWTKAELLVWLVLRKHEDKNGECYPGLRTIMEQTGLSSQAARDGIKGLQNRMVITVAKAHRKVNRYRFLCAKK